MRSNPTTCHCSPKLVMINHPNHNPGRKGFTPHRGTFTKLLSEPTQTKNPQDSALGHKRNNYVFSGVSSDITIISSSSFLISLFNTEHQVNFDSTIEPPKVTHNMIQNVSLTSFSCQLSRPSDTQVTKFSLPHTKTTTQPKIDSLLTLDI